MATETPSSVKWNSLTLAKIEFGYKLQFLERYMVSRTEWGPASRVTSDQCNLGRRGAPADAVEDDSQVAIGSGTSALVPGGNLRK